MILRQKTLFPLDEIICSSDTSVEERIQEFSKFLYKNYPYNKRNWGHPLHSLCSYQSKLKPAIAYFLIRIFTKPGEIVLDPFSGVGTIPFEACLLGRKGIAVDLNPVAFNNTNSKLSKPDRNAIWNVYKDLIAYIKSNDITDDEKHAVNITNINGDLSKYFDKDTFSEIVLARKYFSRITYPTPPQSFVLACMLHILHGNRPYALSRRSHGITPFKPNGDFIYKPVEKHLKDKIERCLANNFGEHFIPGQCFLGSVFNLKKVLPNDLFGKIDACISSPPFFNSTRFYITNWIRFWFCGWNSDDFRETRRLDFVEKLQRKSMDIYISIFENIYGMLKPGGIVVFHLGVVRNKDMGKQVEPYARQSGFKVNNLIYEDVSACEKHGIRDQGSTVKHQFLFLIR